MAYRTIIANFPHYPTTPIHCAQLVDFIDGDVLYPRRNFTVTTDVLGRATFNLDAKTGFSTPWQIQIAGTSYRIEVTPGVEPIGLDDLVLDAQYPTTQLSLVRSQLVTSEAARAALQQSQARAVIVGEHVLLDDFTAEIIGGSRHITGAWWDAQDGALIGGVQSSPATWGSSRVNWSSDALLLEGFARQPGRVYTFGGVTLSDFSDDLAILLSTDIGDTDPRTDAAIGWIVESGELALLTPNGKLTIAAGQSNIRTSQYLLALVDLGSEIAVLIQHVDDDPGGGRDDALRLPGPPYARLPYPPIVLDADALYPVLSALGTGNPTLYPGGHQVQAFRVLDMPLWNRPDVLALFSERFDQVDASTIGYGWTPINSTWRRFGGAVETVTGSGFQLLATDTGVSNGIYRVLIFVPSGPVRSFGLALRVDTPENPQNYIRIINNASDNIFAQVWTNGGFGSQIPDASGDANWIADAWNEVVVFVDGPRYRLMVNRIDVAGGWKTDPSGAHLTNTGIALWSGSDAPTGVRWTDVAVYPHEVLLPAAITAIGGHRSIVPGELLNLPTLVPTVIGQMTFLLGDLGRTDAQVSVRLTVPSGTPTIFAGIACCWDDQGNGIEVRVLRDPVNQPGTDEYEVLEYVGGQVSTSGAAGVVRKTQLGNQWQAGSYTVSVQVLDGELRVLTNGVVWLTYHMVGTFAGTRWGTSRHSSTSAGVTLTHVQARAVYAG